MKATKMQTNGRSHESAQDWLEEARQLVEDHVEDHLVWHSDYADCQCPRGHDARIYIGQTPFMHCLHEKCQDDISAINDALRDASAWLPDAPARLVKTPQERAAEAFKKRLRFLERSARAYILPSLRKQPVPVEHWRRTSPFPVEQYPVEDHWLLYLGGLFASDDLIWSDSDLTRSGPAYVDSFHTAQGWIKGQATPGQFVSAFTFRWTNGARTRENTDKRVLQVLESDILSREEFGAVINWATKYLRLRAITDTGARSLHAGFDPFEPKPVQFPPHPQREIWTKVPDDLRWLGGSNNGDSFHVEITENTSYATELAAWEARYGVAWERYWRQREQWNKRRLELFAILAGLGCDKHMLTTTLTTRLPGHPRLDEQGNETGRWQQLLYLDPTFPL